MVEMISSIDAILLCCEFFCLGGSIFADGEGTKNALRIALVVFAILVMVF